MVTIKGYKVADVGYYINLDRREDRRQKIQLQIVSNEIDGLERHSANSSTDSRPLNCKLSHYEVYKKFIQSGAESLLVLEDDCLFLPYAYERAEEVFRDISEVEFDLFWLGCKNRRSPKSYRNKTFQVQSVSHAHSYIIGRKLCQYIIDNFNEYEHNGLTIDELLSLVPFGYDVCCDPNKFGYYQMDNPVEELQVYFISLCYERSLTTQYSSYSDITEVNVDYETYISSSFPIFENTGEK